MCIRDRYSVVARRHEQKWYVAGVNAEDTQKNLKLKLPMLTDGKAIIYNDDKNKNTFKGDVKISKNGELSITIQPKGGFVLVK